MDGYWANDVIVSVIFWNRDPAGYSDLYRVWFGFILTISAQDYQNYKDAYAFDQLCNSLGSLYAGFFRAFAERKESEILKRLDYIRT